MTSASLLVQILTGLAGASTLFLTGAGLSLIFGVTRVVNFAHGSLFMVGAYLGWTAGEWLRALLPGSAAGFWLATLLATLGVAALGALLETLILRRIYRAPELFQLLATFAVALVLRDGCLWLWGAEDLLGPRVPGLTGALSVLGVPFPRYDAALIVIGPAVLGLMHLLLTRTHFGVLIRAATQDREMVSALGVIESRLFTSVFAIGAGLAGLAGALQLPREPANLGLDLPAISDAFVVVVIGGLGSLPGAFLAALLISLVKAGCVALGTVELGGYSFAFPRLTLVAEFIVMAIVLVVRPYGLMGRPEGALRGPAASPIRPEPETPRSRALWGLAIAALALLPWIASASPYTTVALVDVFCFALFAMSLFFIMGPGGMHSFGHAAYFGLGAYGAAIVLKATGWSMMWGLLIGPLAGFVGALIFGWFSVRLSGVYLAMLTLAFGQIVWSIIYQWDAVTGGSNGLTGLWPAGWLSTRYPGVTPNAAYYLLTLACVGSAVLVLRRVLDAPFGLAVRAGRDSPLRAESIGINVHRIQWMAFCVAGTAAGLAGVLYAFSKGSIAPDLVHVGRSIDGLVMVLLGGVESLAGPLIGAAAFTLLQDSAGRSFDYWRAATGAAMLVVVLAFPQGLAGLARSIRGRAKA